MMQYYKKSSYIREIELNAQSILFNSFHNRKMVITGARGLIGSELIDTVMWANSHHGLNCKIYAIVRNTDEAIQRFGQYLGDNNFELLSLDINQEKIPINEDIDFFIHGASNTHPVFYSSRPVETILTNTIGTANTLQFAVEHHCQKYIFLSSVEIYGENRGDVEAFSESYCGYIDCNTLRAGYTESKRCGEALCQAYIKQYDLDCVIPRIARCYGAGLLQEDSKALSQFIKKGIAHENIVLKSEGNQYYSYVYVADAVTALLTIIAKGEKGEAYNVVGSHSNITLRELAKLIAEQVGTTVVYEIPDDCEVAGYSKATKAIMDGNKIEKLGWKWKYSIEEGIRQVICLLD